MWSMTIMVLPKGNLVVSVVSVGQWVSIGAEIPCPRTCPLAFDRQTSSFQGVGRMLSS